MFLDQSADFLNMEEVLLIHFDSVIILQVSVIHQCCVHMDWWPHNYFIEFISFVWIILLILDADLHLLQPFKNLPSESDECGFAALKPCRQDGCVLFCWIYFDFESNIV